LTQLAALTELIVKFRDERDWKQFHHPKDLGVALSIEASEVLELFRFKSNEEIQARLAQGPWPDLGHELADILYFVLLLAHDTGVDLESALVEKLKISGEKYPVELSRGNNAKYTELKS
ncbi:unnamed protein product, partial [Phaeothamnion confervicola]